MSFSLGFLVGTASAKNELFYHITIPKLIFFRVQGHLERIRQYISQTNTFVLFQRLL
jgi:hypothetical protein